MHGGLWRPATLACFGDNGGIDPPTYIEFGGHAKVSRFQKFGQAVSHLVGDGLVEGADVSKAPNVEF